MGLQNLYNVATLKVPPLLAAQDASARSRARERLLCRNDYPKMSKSISEESTFWISSNPKVRPPGPPFSLMKRRATDSGFAKAIDPIDRVLIT